jgi:LmbE family N-acetylglucosaminyl deacetylase
MDKRDNASFNSSLLAACLDYVTLFHELYEIGRAWRPPAESPGAFLPLPLHQGRHDILICSPHPDDEALCAGLPLRLMDNACRVLTLALTLGSDPTRKDQRQRELAASCRMLGFDCLLIQEPLGFSKLASPQQEEKAPEWRQQRDVLIDHFIREMPSLILFPHAGDGHPAHIRVHHLALSAARRYSEMKRRTVLIAETEFWHPMARPNLMLGLTPDMVARLMASLICHRSQMVRNPLHLRLPARLMDNVRRGSEIMNYGGDAPPFAFAELYRIMTLNCGAWDNKKGETAMTVSPEYPLTFAGLQGF